MLAAKMTEAAHQKLSSVLKLPMNDFGTFSATILAKSQLTPHVQSGKMYWTLILADDETSCTMKGFNRVIYDELRQERTYRFSNVQRKVGDDSFWFVSSSSIMMQKTIAIHEDLRKTALQNNSQGSPERKVHDALLSASTSVIKGKVAQVSKKFKHCLMLLTFYLFNYFLIFLNDS